MLNFLSRTRFPSDKLAMPCVERVCFLGLSPRYAESSPFTTALIYLDAEESDEDHQVEQLGRWEMRTLSVFASCSTSMARLVTYGPAATTLSLPAPAGCTISTDSMHSSLTARPCRFRPNSRRKKVPGAETSRALFGSSCSAEFLCRSQWPS